jgi:hypothetical protein
MFMASFVKRAEPSKAAQGTKAKAAPFTPVAVSAAAAFCGCVSCLLYSSASHPSSSPPPSFSPFKSLAQYPSPALQ